MPLEIREHGVSFSCPGQAILEYSLDLDEYRAGSDYLQFLADSSPWPYFPLAGEYAYLPGYALFLAPDDPGTPCRVEVELPGDWTCAGPLVEEGLVTGDLWRDPLLAGRLSKAGSGNLELVYPAPVSPHLGLLEAARKADSILKELYASLPGVGEPGKIHVFLLPWEAGNGEVGPAATESFSRTLVIPLTPGTSPLADDVLGELSRQAAGIAIRRCATFSEDSLWFEKGMAWYLRDILPYRAGLWGASLSWDRLLGQYQAYRERAEGISLFRAGATEDLGERESAAICHGGAVACAAIDAELQDSGPGGMDVLRFLDLLSSGAGKGKESPITSRDIEELLTSQTGKNWKPFFEDHIYGTDVIPASSFSSLRVAPRVEGLAHPVRTGSPGLGKWTALVLAVLVVFALPFFLEPYTLRPRKEGFLERVLRE